MTPQTALEGEQSAIPPVIVKSGGDPHVSITSESIRFAETVTAPSWSSSQSTKTGRITQLKIRVGQQTTVLPITPGLQLASVTFDFGPAQLIAMESGDPDPTKENNVLLLLASPEVPFDVKTDSGVVLDGDWNISKTHVPNTIKSVTLMVGDVLQLSSEFETDDVEVEIYFN
ncbi:MAG TPA: hypothetical protein VLB46_21685 [Pyrinomonadaceae bacterium]|nr:hypothetical protein [Pyrinomonadaceae bacterium]